jgi:hypothetical protein
VRHAGWLAITAVAPGLARDTHQHRRRHLGSIGENIPQRRRLKRPMMFKIPYTEKIFVAGKLSH